MRKKIKILTICSAIDLDIIGGMTPMYWQLFGKLNELGVEIIVIPIRGKALSSLWWRHYENPLLSIQSSFINNLIQKVYTSSWQRVTDNKNYTMDHKSNFNIGAQISKIKVTISDNIKNSYVANLMLPKWKECLSKVWNIERGIDVIILFNPLSFSNYMIKELPKFIHRNFGIPVILYFADLPTFFWDNENFKLSPIYNSDINEYDAFLVNSEGIIDKLINLGASRVYILHFGADPNLFAPIEVKKDIDISFYGYGAKLREEAMRYMITDPSNELRNVIFRTAGKFSIDLGYSKNIGFLRFDSLKRFCCRSKINLNITRRTFAETYCSSTARPFELAAMECCIVSNDCKGIDKLFVPNKEIIISKNKDETIEIYKWLISSDEERLKIGRNARKKVLKEHTYNHRAKQLFEIINQIT